MTALATANASNAGAAPSEARGRFRSAVEAAMEAAMLPARLAARVYEAGRGALASVECLTPGKIAGAAWGAAAEGAELFMMKLRMLLQRTRGGVLMLGAPEGCTEPAAPELAAASEEGKQEEGPAGDCALVAGASVEAEPVKPAAEEPQAERAIELESEPAVLKDKSELPADDAGTDMAVPSEPATPARAPAAFAPSSPREERSEPAEVATAEDALSEAGASADEPSTPVAESDVQQEEEVLPGAEEGEAAAAGNENAEVVASEAEVAAEAPIPAAVPEGEAAPVEAATPVEAPPAAAAELEAAGEVEVDGQAAAATAALAGSEPEPAVAMEADEGEADVAARAAASEEADLVFVVTEDGAAELIEEDKAAAAVAEVAAPPSPPALDAEAAAAAEETLTALSAEALADALPEPAPKPATPTASEPEIVPAPRTPAASIVGGMRVAAASPKKKKRNPMHKVQKMLGLKPSGASSSKSRR